jgi:hypothetical protein
MFLKPDRRTLLGGGVYKVLGTFVFEIFVKFSKKAID